MRSARFSTAISRHYRFATTEKPRAALSSKKKKVRRKFEKNITRLRETPAAVLSRDYSAVSSMPIIRIIFNRLCIRAFRRDQLRVIMRTRAKFPFGGCLFVCDTTNKIRTINTRKSVEPVFLCVRSWTGGTRIFNTGVRYLPVFSVRPVSAVSRWYLPCHGVFGRVVTPVKHDRGK